MTKLFYTSTSIVLLLYCNIENRTRDVGGVRARNDANRYRGFGRVFMSGCNRHCNRKPRFQRHDLNLKHHLPANNEITIMIVASVLQSTPEHRNLTRSLDLDIINVEPKA